MLQTFTSKLFIVGTFLALPLMQAKADVVDEIEKSFSVSSEATFRLDNINGSVEISGWNKNEIQVNAVITADDQDDRDRINIKFIHEGDSVMVKTQYEEMSSWGGNQSGKVEYVVMVPNTTELAALDLVNGSLVVENVSGNVKAELVNGSIVAKGLKGDGSFNSVNGSIKVFYSDYSQNIGEIDLSTVNGSVKLYLPSELNANISAETMHGSIKNDFGLVSDDNMFVGRHLEGSVGSGSLDINIESVNGSIKILKH